MKRMVFVAGIVAISAFAASIAAAGEPVAMNNDYSVDVDIMPKYVMPYAGDCSGGGYAGVVIHENATVAIADVECPQTYGVGAQGPQLMITTPGPVSRSIPITVALNTAYHLRILVKGTNLYVTMPGLGDLNWEGAPIKPNPTEWPKSVLYRYLAEFTAYTVVRLDEQGQPIPNVPPKPEAAPAQKPRFSAPTAPLPPPPPPATAPSPASDWMPPPPPPPGQ